MPGELTRNSDMGTVHLVGLNTNLAYTNSKVLTQVSWIQDQPWGLPHIAVRISTGGAISQRLRTANSCGFGD